MFGGILGGVASAFGLGKKASSLASLAGGLLQRNDARVSARNAQNFSAEMANTAWQRGMADMKKAGLNPILAYQQGAAPSPGGVQAPVFDVVTPAVHTGLQASQTEATVSKTEQEISNLKVAQDLNKVQIKQVSSVVDHLKEQIKLTIQQRQKTFQDTMSVNYDNVAKAIMAEFFKGNKAALIAREMGIGDGVFKTIIRTLLGIGGKSDVLDSRDPANSKIPAWSNLK